MVLYPTLEYGPYAIPKAVIMNNYLDWKREQGSQLFISDMRVIQMELSVRLKKLMPEIEGIRKKFEGVGFKNQHQDKIG